MSRIKIEDLPVMEAMDQADAAETIGGASYRYSYRYPTYRYTPPYRPPVYNPGYYNPGNRLLPGNDGGSSPSFRRY